VIVAEVVIRVHLVEIQTAKNNGLGILLSVTLKVISHSLETVYPRLFYFIASADQY